MKTLLTMGVLLLCTYAYCQENTLDFNDLSALLHFDDNRTDSLLTAKGWEYMWHYIDSTEDNKQLTQYGYQVKYGDVDDSNNSASFFLIISANAQGTKYAINLHYALQIEYFNQITQQALASGFKYVDDKKGPYSLYKFYESKNEALITVSDSKGDSSTNINTGKAVMAHTYWSILIAKNKYYKKYRAKHGIKNT